MKIVQSLLAYPILFMIIPFILTLFIYLVVKFLPIHQWRKIHLTAQWSALFYVVGVVVLVDALFDLFILSYILIFFIVILAIHMIVQWKKDVEISLRKAMVLLLRMTFLIFLFTYVLLITVYVIRFFA